MDYTHFFFTAAAVFLGSGCALSILWSSVQTELTRRDERWKGEPEEDRLEKLAQKVHDEFNAYERGREKRRENLPFWGDGYSSKEEKTSEEHNNSWAKKYYESLSLGYSWKFRSGTPAENFECLSSGLYELHQCFDDLWVGEAKLGRDEELLEIARLRRDPHNTAECLRAIRRHNEVLPIVKQRLDHRRYQLNRSIKYFENLKDGVTEEDADAKAIEQLGPGPKWPIEVGAFRYHNYFYIHDRHHT